MKRILVGVLLVLALGIGVGLSGCSGDSSDDETLLNVSYDPTRELWKDLNEAFIAHHQQETGKTVAVKQSHGGSGSQARAVGDGLEADVVTLALWSDTDSIRQKGLIRDNWDSAPPNGLPYYSTIVFVVRKGNPKGIKDWADLVKPGVEIITPNPKTSGNGQLSFLAAWASVIHNGGSEEKAREFVTRLYSQAPVLDTAARGSTVTFAQNGIGDVHLTWENEAYLEKAEFEDKFEIVYPKASIRAEPYVAVVDKNVDRKNTRSLAEAYLKFTYSDEAQEIIAKHHYRPTSEAVRKKYAANFPEIELIPVTRIAANWGEVRAKFFGNKAVFDQVIDEVNRNRQK